MTFPRHQPPRPARRFINRTHAWRVFIVPSPLMGGMVQAESRGERDMVIRLETDQTVTGYWSQPQRLEYEYEGKTRSYTPDYELLRDGHPILAEVKPDDQASAPENQGLYDAIGEAARRRGREFELWSYSRIRSDPIWSNAELIFRAVGLRPSVEEHRRLEIELSRRTTYCVADAIAVLGCERSVRAAVLYRILWADLSAPWGPDTIVAVNRSPSSSIRQRKPQ